MYSCASPGDKNYFSACSYFGPNNSYSPTFLAQDQVDSVEANHPDYDKFSRSWKIMRHCIAGQDEVRKHAEEMEYLQIPSAAQTEEELTTHRATYERSSKHHYIYKAHYIEVVGRMIDEIEGRIFSKKYKYTVPSQLEKIKDGLDSEGLSFDQYARWCVKEVFSTKRFGVLVDWDENEGHSVFKRYTAENIVNWKINKHGIPTLVVLEDFIDEPDQIFSHNKITRRIAFVLEKDSSGDAYVVQRTFTKTKDNNKKFEESEPPKVLTRRGMSLTKIPFIFFGGIKPTAPMLKPLAAASLDFFDAHASYRNALWWATTEQPYISFEQGEDKEFGFLGQNGIEKDGTEPKGMEIIWGSATPICLINGQIKFAHVSGIGLTAARQRLIDAKAEMTGLGARSFNAQTASNIKVQTERMQQRAEGSVIGSNAYAISMGIKHALEIAAEWNDIKGDISFELNQDYTDDFELPFLKEIGDAVEKLMLPYELIYNYLRQNSDIIPDNVSNQDIMKMLDQQQDSILGFSYEDIEQQGLEEEDEQSEDIRFIGREADPVT